MEYVTRAVESSLLASVSTRRCSRNTVARQLSINSAATIRRASIQTSESRHYSVELRTSCVLLLCCDRDVAVRNGGAAVEVIASTAARCSPLKLKITLHHKTRRTERGEAFCLSPLFFPSITHYPASLTKSNLFSPSFIIYTLTGFPPIFSLSVSSLRFPPVELWPQ